MQYYCLFQVVGRNFLQNPIDAMKEMIFSSIQQFKILSIFKYKTNESFITSINQFVTCLLTIFGLLFGVRGGRFGVFT